MIVLLSPAKNMNFDPAPEALAATQPVFLKDARIIGGCAQKLTLAGLKKLMRISDKLAQLNHDRFRTFRGDGKSNSQKQAALAFNGDVYLGLDAASMTPDDFAFAQENLRILSGLYGLLRPLDAIEPYRLEMGSALKNPGGANLYAFWSGKIADELNKTAATHKDGRIVNLASHEYFSAVDRSVLKSPVVTLNFKEEKDGELRQLQFFAKRARGTMARWAIDNRIDRVEDLKGFTIGGYKFRKRDSKEFDWLFTRPQPQPKPRAKAA